MTAQPKRSSSESKVAKIDEATSNVQETIRQRAYEIYEHRGRQDGRDLDDWLQAESEVMTKDKIAVAA